MVAVATTGMNRFLRIQFRDCPSLLLCIVSVIVLAAYGIYRGGLSGVAYLIDTYLAGLAALMCARYLTLAHCKKLLRLIILFAVLSSLVAIWEFITKTLVFPPKMQFGFFRASGFFGHPLTAGLISIIAMFAALSLSTSLWRKGAAIVVLYLALYAYGSRGALAVATVFLALALLAVPFVWRTRETNKALSIPIVTLAVVLAAYSTIYVTFQTDFGASIGSRFAVDENVLVRIGALQLMTQLSLGELFWGIDGSYGRWVDSMSGMEIVENFLVVLVLQFGAVAVICLLISFVGLFSVMMRSASYFQWLLLGASLVAAVTNNSLSSKTPALLLLLLTLNLISRVRSGAPFVSPRKTVRRAGLGSLI